MAKVDHDRALAWAREHRDMNDPAPAGNAARAYLWERARNDGLIEDARVASESAMNLRTRVAELEAECERLREALDDLFGAVVHGQHCGACGCDFTKSEHAKTCEARAAIPLLSKGGGSGVEVSAAWHAKEAECERLREALALCLANLQEIDDGDAMDVRPAVMREAAALLSKGAIDGE